MDSPANLFADNTKRHLWVWVDPSDSMIYHNMNIVGTFCSIPPNTAGETLMFIPNPSFQGLISPFQNNMMRSFKAEYNLELVRRARFPQFPCRLQAVFLLESEADAYAYQTKNPTHVEGRILVRGTTNGAYCFSKHDSSWINFFRLSHTMEEEDVNSAANAYWSGLSVQDCQLTSCGKPWTQERATEILFLGRLDFERQPNAQSQQH